MYVCIYVRMYVYMYGYRYVCIYVCMYAYMYVCMYVCMYVTDILLYVGIARCVLCKKNSRHKKNLKFISAFKILNNWIYPEPLKSRLKSATFPLKVYVNETHLF